MSNLIDQTIAAVQDISADLRPVVLDEFGVAAAIEWQLDHYAERTGLECRFETDRGFAVGDRELATTLFRVFQELLTNVVRHARARHVAVTLERCDGALELRVADDGIGIDEEALRDSRSLGILGIRERVQRLDGELVIEGRRGEGTVVRVRFPERAAEPDGSSGPGEPAEHGKTVDAATPGARRPAPESG
jgi:signal transduction histidine kinase